MDKPDKNVSTLAENYDLSNTCGSSSKNNKNEIKNELFIDENSSVEDNDSDSLEQDNNHDLNETEKNDITPENIKKIDDVIAECEKKPVMELKNLDDECNSNKSVPNVLKSNELEVTNMILEQKNNEELDVESKIFNNNELSSNNMENLYEQNESISPADAKSQNLSFVIDFDSNELKNKKVNINLKYNKILERFQNKYRNDMTANSSESKLSENSNLDKTLIEPADQTDKVILESTKLKKSPSVETFSGKNIGKKEICNQEVAKVRLRTRDRSASRVRDISSSNRHSWSPRSSTFEPLQSENRDINLELSSKLRKRPTSAKKTIESIETKKNTQKFVQNKSSVSSKYNQNIDRYDSKQLNKNEFSPRSSAMQLALEKTNYLGMQPPLDDFKPATLIYGSGDEVSEAGTYTLDGDNYTEEQKQLMNIDKKKKLEMNRESEVSHISVGLSPCDLYGTVENRRKNVLETTMYFQRSPDLNHKNSYLEKIKSKVKSRSKISNDSSASSFDNVSVSDTGTFTSITTSGVLAKKPTLDKNPRLTRKSSLTTSQIDSSEYISGTNDRIKTTDSSYMPYTDYQKASLIYQNDAQNLNNIDSNTSPKNCISKLSDATALKTAQTKSDWIQEWARNARARSVIGATRPSANEKPLMSQSYNCEADANELTPRFNTNFRGLAKTKTDHDNKIMELQNQIEKLKANDPDMHECSSESNFNRNYYSSRPPMSPSKIPSPIHSIGRSRTDGKPRIRNISPNGNDTDIYLRKTESVISNLSNNLSRRNGNSLCNENKNYYSADESSPTARTHKRNLSLDYKYNVYPNEVGNNDFYKKNSMNMNKYIQQHMWSPNHIYKPLIPQNDELAKEKISSPLRRSTSFSVKSSSNYKNPITSPKYEQRKTHQRTNSNQNLINSTALHKSASSGYVNSIQYYINDQDDLDYYSSDELEQSLSLETSPSGLNNRPDDSPISNTRYNKALLMRIERSKQKCHAATEKGAMACPNTPELQRRTSHRSSTRQSVPRDSSLNRLKDDIPNSLSSAKKQILQNSGSSTRPQPRYMDISKYKPAQGNAFLKKDESKVTLKTDIKRSSSSNSMALDRGDTVRSSCRSSRSTTTGNNKSSSAKRDSSVSKQKEIELAMWRRRAKYDPMKAAAADKKRREENKKIIDFAKEEERAISS